MKHKLTAAGLFCFSILYMAGGWDLKLGTLKKPGPGMFPRLIGIGLLVCTGIYLWQVLRKQVESRPSPERVNPRIVVWLAGAILIYPFLLNYLNFILATFAVVYFMLLILKFQGPFWDFVIALGLVLISFMGFAMVLGVSLSIGPVEEIFFRLRG
jgi:hypothetical protein